MGGTRKERKEERLCLAGGGREEGSPGLSGHALYAGNNWAGRRLVHMLKTVKSWSKGV